MVRFFLHLRHTAVLSMALLLSATLLTLSFDPAVANFGDPCSKFKKGSKKWKKCKKYRYKPGAFSTEDERFMAGYWLAKNGRYQEALDVLANAKAGNDPRILNYIGYATRKLGRVHEALVYYRKAVSIAPDYVVSRGYMGEALLETGDKAAALRQLREIAARCGTSCEPYLTLKTEIDRAELM